MHEWIMVANEIIGAAAGIINIYILLAKVIKLPKKQKRRFCNKHRSK